MSNFDKDLLNDDFRITRIDSLLFDIHITPEDAEGSPEMRQWVDPVPRRIGFFFRASKECSFSIPDQRIMHHARGARLLSGRVKHFGKGWSVEQWERKCEYYANEFGHPGYIDKWNSRRGKAVKQDYRSDTGDPLVRWDDIWTNLNEQKESMPAMA